MSFILQLRLFESFFPLGSHSLRRSTSARQQLSRRTVHNGGEALNDCVKSSSKVKAVLPNFRWRLEKSCGHVYVSRCLLIGLAMPASFLKGFQIDSIRM